MFNHYYYSPPSSSWHYFTKWMLVAPMQTTQYSTGCSTALYYFYNANTRGPVALRLESCVFIPTTQWSPCSLWGSMPPACLSLTSSTLAYDSTYGDLLSLLPSDFLVDSSKSSWWYHLCAPLLGPISTLIVLNSPHRNSCDWLNNSLSTKLIEYFLSQPHRKWYKYWYYTVFDRTQKSTHSLFCNITWDYLILSPHQSLHN